MLNILDTLEVLLMALVLVNLKNYLDLVKRKKNNKVKVIINGLNGEIKDKAIKDIIIKMINSKKIAKFFE